MATIKDKGQEGLEGNGGAYYAEIHQQQITDKVNEILPLLNGMSVSAIKLVLKSLRNYSQLIPISIHQD